MPPSTLTSHSSRRVRPLIAALCTSALLLIPNISRGEDIAVAARVFNGYARTRLPDKSFKPETYTFAEGGRWDAALAGDSIDKLPFVKIAAKLVKPLAAQGYVQSADPKATSLLIMVFWGTTRGTEDRDATPTQDGLQEAAKTLSIDLIAARADLKSQDPVKQEAAKEQIARSQERAESAYTAMAMQQKMEDLDDQRNAAILGFQTEMWRVYTTQNSGAAQDLLTELRSNRYFVVMKAYDFQKAWKEKRRKILWEARFSIQERGNDFAEQLPAMASFASRYFGKELNNLIRRPLPTGNVELGETQFIGYEPKK